MILDLVLIVIKWLEVVKHVDTCGAVFAHLRLSDLEVTEIQQQDVLSATVKATLWNDDVRGHQVHLQVENFLCFNHVHQT